MRLINRIPEEQVQISISHSNESVSNTGMTLISVEIPLNAIKWLNGESLIDCISNRALPDLTARLGAINQQFTLAELAEASNIIAVGESVPASGIIYQKVMESFLIQNDDALNGEIVITTDKISFINPNGI